MLNELENKIRKAIPELNQICVDFSKPKIYLNHVLEYVKELLKSKGVLLDRIYYIFILIMSNWNLKSKLLSEQSKGLIKYINEL